MNLNIYSIYDTATAAYMRPFFLQSDGQATRMFGDLAQNADHEVGQHPEDYSLYRIGIYDDQTAKLIPQEKTCLATALEIIAANKNVNRDNMELFNNQTNGDKQHA